MGAGEAEQDIGFGPDRGLTGDLVQTRRARILRRLARVTGGVTLAALALGGRTVLADVRHEAIEAAGFTKVTVEPILRFGRITRRVKP